MQKRFQVLTITLLLSVAGSFTPNDKVSVPTSFEGRLSAFMQFTSARLADAAKPWRRPPKATVFFPASTPASVRPMLTWSKVRGAVMYEFELLPYNLPFLDKDSLSPTRLFSTRQIYNSGFNPDLTIYIGKAPLFWRVRALNFDGEPISSFSTPVPIYIDPELEPVSAPVPTAFFNAYNGSTLLYPVYSWLPISRAVQYEVELLDDAPENPGGTAPSQHRIWSAVTSLSDKYDDYPRISQKPFYWRVRGLDEKGEAVGVYSDAVSFVNDPDKGWQIATYGDSISHGGGNLSYSPADWEYSYQTYLNFPTVNLSNSGDTSSSCLERFDSDVLPFRPRYLIILEGTNSIRGGASAAEVASDLKALRDKCLKNNIRPIFLTLPPINPDSISKVFGEETAPNWREEMDSLNEFIRTLPHIDIASLFNYPDGIMPPALSLDGLHPDITAKRKTAELINSKFPELIRTLPQ